MELDRLKIGVVGGGTMSKEISKALMESRYPIVLKARKEADIRAITSLSQKTFKKLLRRKKISQKEHDYLIANTSGTTLFDNSYKELDIVIETIVEDAEIKKKLYRELEDVCSPKAVFCTNTSSLSINALAERLKRKDRFLGLHFFQPFRAFNFIEVIKGKETSTDSLDIIKKVVQSLNKYPLQVMDSPGFLFNRVQLTVALEAFLAIESGWYDIEELNEAFKTSKFYTPLYHSFDKLGLDILESCFKNFHRCWPHRYPLPELTTAMTGRNRYGEKCGKGFFSYHITPAVIDEEMQSIVNDFRHRRSSKKYAFSPEMAIVRAMNEGIYCLEEGLADLQEMERAISSLPPFFYMGGFYRAMDQMGLDDLYRKLMEYEKSFGARFHPADLLKEMVERGHLGVKTGQGFFRYE